MKKLILICGLALVGFTSCKKKDTSPSPTTPSTTSPIVTDSMTMIVGTWHLKKSYLKLKTSSTYGEEFVHNLYLNSNPNYNKVIFTNTSSPYYSGFYNCSPGLMSKSCSDASQGFYGSYKIVGNLLYFPGMSMDIVSLSNTSLIIKLSSGTSGATYFEYDKSGNNPPTNNDLLLFGTWRLDSLGGLIKKVNTSNYSITFSPITGNGTLCDKYYTISQNGTLLDTDQNSFNIPDNFSSINKFATHEDNLLTGLSALSDIHNPGKIRELTTTNLKYFSLGGGTTYYFTKQ